MGTLGDDRIAVTVRIDPRHREITEMPLAVGDQVRVFTRLFDDRQKGRRAPLASNGNTLEVRELSKEGVLLRNAAGAEGFVKWENLAPGRKKGVPLNLAYGSALTVDTSQGMTSPSTSTCRSADPTPSSGARTTWPKAAIAIRRGW